jgi:high-affinity nickel permease
VFLLIIAAINVVILLNVYRAFRRVKQDGAFVPEDLDLMRQRAACSHACSTGCSA